MKTKKIDQICAKGKEEFYYGKDLERIGRLDEAVNDIIKLERQWMRFLQIILFKIEI